MNLSKVIELFNSGDWDRIEPIFGNIQNFLNYLKSRDKLYLIDFKSIYETFNDFTINEVSIFFLREFGPDYFLEYLVDVNKIGDDYFLYLDDLSEFSSLFDDYNGGRGMSDSEIVREVLGEDWFEMFSDTVYNYYDDIVEELDEKNLNELKEIILRDLEKQNLEPEHFSGLFFEDNIGYDGYVQINSNNIDYVLSDKKTFQELIISGYLKELKSNLSSLHNMSYNESWNDSTFDQIKEYLSQYVDTNFIWESKDVGGRQKNFIHCKIKHLNVDIFNYLNCSKGYDNGTLYDQGGYLDMLSEEMMTCGELFQLNLREYVDSYKVREYLNGSFLDYVY